MAKQDRLKDLLVIEEQQLQTLIREAEEKLDAVRKLLGRPQPTVATTTSAPKKERKEKVKPVGKTRGSETWEQYVITILKEIGGKGKAADVVDYALKANPDTPEVTIKNAITGKLSKLYRKNKIGAKTSGPKTEGYEFFLLSNNGLFSENGQK